MRPDPRRNRDRSGITLTEILISILIMGIGLVSLATLFPVGLERIRNAQRAARSAMLTESAAASLPTINLFGRERFNASPWYQPGTGGPLVPFAYDPWMQDTPLPTPTTIGGVYRGWGGNGFRLVDPSTGNPWAQGLPLNYRAGDGLPVAYDPLWWAAINSAQLQSGQAPAYTPRILGYNGRFGQAVLLGGSGTVLTNSGVRDDPDGGPPSAHGLPRLDSLGFYNPVAARFGFPLAGALSTFASQDDMVLLTANPAAAQGEQGAPVLPLVDLSPTNLGIGGQAPSGAFQRDYAFSWMFTGRRSDVSSGAIYDGDIVVFHNRPFAVDVDPATSAPVPAGERTVEAVFAYGTAVQGQLANGNFTTTLGYSQRDRTVLLRWPINQPDPDVRVGGWIADVTYERVNARDLARFGPGVPLKLTYPGQRCHWYRVVRKGETENEVVGVTTAPADANYRRIVLTIETPVQAKTLLQAGGNPVNVNVALVSPYVVNVYPKVFTTR
jgi:type II secretory pathway pseudopilin PulG